MRKIRPAKIFLSVLFLATFFAAECGALTVRAKNNHHEAIYTAFVYYDENREEWMKVAWYEIKPGQTRAIDFPDADIGTIYYYAKNRNYTQQWTVPDDSPRADVQDVVNEKMYLPANDTPKGTDYRYVNFIEYEFDTDEITLNFNASAGGSANTSVGDSARRSDSVRPSWGSVTLPMMNSGSVKAPLGNIHLYKVWLGRWDESKRKRIQGFLDTDLTFISTDARFYGKEVRFTQHDSFLNFRRLTDNDKEPAEEYDTLVEILRRAYKISPEDMNAYARKQGYDGWALLIFADQVGRSFGSNANWGSDNMETLIFYTTTPMKNNRGGGSLEPTSGHVITHELLHVFGAIDLYQNNLFTASQAAQVKKLWPDEIMIDDKSQASFRIHKYTAYQLGWHGNWDRTWNSLKPANSERR